MRFKLLSKDDKIIYKNEILEMMRVSDKDFVPPLSARNSTLQKDLTSFKSSTDGIVKYYAEMERQEILGVFDDDNLIGFVSFRIDYVCDVIDDSSKPNIYLSTLILKPETRGRGITRLLYDYLFNTLYPTRSIFTRTWSTNIAHTKILFGFGFSELSRKINDRGEGIDTVYYSLIRK